MTLSEAFARGQRESAKSTIYVIFILVGFFFSPPLLLKDRGTLPKVLRVRDGETPPPSLSSLRPLRMFPD